MESIEIAGREEEIAKMQAALLSKQAELIAVYGRRRVGKTFLIRKVFEKELCFDLSGSQHAILEVQLRNFASMLGGYMQAGVKIAPPANWPEAFEMLGQYINGITTATKKVIFFDELPWLDTMHSGFLSAFDYFWNSWCTKRSDIIVVICGSAASWMINKIVHNKRGLHNRITRQIRLLPFTLAETQAFFKIKNIKLDEYQVAQLYMVMGGVPHYLNEVQPGKSAIQNIDTICFAEKALLREEFDVLYQSLYDSAEIHTAIIRALATRRMGLSRNEIVTLAKLKSGGHLSNVLNELEESGFIAAYTPLNKKVKDAVYRLSDEYSLFYLKFIEKSKSYQPGTWALLSSSSTWKAWSGYAFENLCLKHVRKIKMALQIGSIYSEQSAWYGKEEGAQIDLVIERADRCINICEMKFANTAYEITSKYAKELQHKAMAYRTATKTNKTIFITMITTYGVKPNEYSGQYVDSHVVLKDLF